MSINIDYSDTKQSAVLSALETCPDRHWNAIRRVCEDNCSNITNTGMRSFSLPWWRFVSFRQALGYVLNQRQVKPLFSATAKAHLQTAQDRVNAYNLANQRTWSQHEVQSQLETAGFKRTLLDFQVRNVAHLASLPSGATFSVPGAGKTTEALSIFALTRNCDDRLLVISPKNAFTAWEEELPICMPNAGIKIIRLTGGTDRIRYLLSHDPMAVVITYQQLSYVMDDLVAYVTRNPTHLFIDESHRMERGVAGVYGANILSMSHLPKRKLIMSGTPMPNAVQDLVPQFQFLYPEIHVDENNVIGNISRVSVRTTKGELGLPAPIRSKILTPMAPGQRILYESLRSDAARKIQGLKATDRIRFRAFARCVLHMIQVASNPSLLANSDLADNHLFQEALSEGLSPKITQACRIAREQATANKKTVIWSSFVSTVEHIAMLLEDIGAEFIHGGVYTSDDDDDFASREAKIKRFNAPDSDCMVLVANPAACSEGISLHHVCHHAIYVDRNFNAAHYLQSEDRIHRIGLGDVNTYVTMLHSPNSVDDVIERRLTLKVNAMGQALNDPNLTIQTLDLDSIDENELPAALDVDDFEAVRNMLLGNEPC